jgi:toxin ParE1/3/4
MTKKYLLTTDAKSDLLEIRKYTKLEWGGEQAREYLQTLQQKIELLSENAEIGKERLEVGRDVYSFPHTSHIIYYLKAHEQIVIFAILHKSMVPQKHLFNRSETV